MADVWDGIVIGGAGGALAGITVVVSQFLATKWKERQDRNAVHRWLDDNTEDVAGKQFRSTRAIASWTNLTQDRVRYVCSLDERIFLSMGEKEDMWGLHDRVPRSVYEERGPRTF